MDNADWKQLLQSIILGLIFSYLLAKLISILFSFKEDNLTLTRVRDAPTVASNVAPDMTDKDSVLAEHGSVRNETDNEDEDGDDGLGSDSDWEGVESTELDEMFSAATVFVAAAAADRALARSVGNDEQLRLYGLYKIATEGPCTGPQPSALKMTARAKWQAWHNLGAMPPEEAMQQYIDIVTELYPSWLDGSSTRSKRVSGDAPIADARGPMGPVFSTFVHEESGNDLKMEEIHAFAREGAIDNLLQCVKSGVSVNVKDSEGRTPLHWAVDRGHQEVVELLVNQHADVNAQDDEGQTPLHYAMVCERESMAEFLVKHKADLDIKDNEGSYPADLCESNWPWLQTAMAGVR
ncbi:hypothetical protein MLD38_033487 [Melastoma candidum]|uniref:Uncharacterized protein n=1 Tax=Melastoma candidum TaxID=119954 RepID=A0ACB9M970_9MYRT|nr:hypothetical protein MLD38_033487 [Melastoma candidum]